MSYVTSLSLLFLIKKLSSKKKFDNYFSITKLSAAPSQKAEPWKELKTVLAPSLTVWALALWNWSGSASSWQYLNIAGPINLLKKSFMTQINDYKKCQQCPCKRLILVYKFQALCHKKKKNPHTQGTIEPMMQSEVKLTQFEMLQTVHCRILCKDLRIPALSFSDWIWKEKRIYIHCP